MGNSAQKLFLISILSATLTFSALTAKANTDLDRKFALESVGVLKEWDNVDELFADYVSAAYKDYFAKQSRFVLQDLSKGDTLLTHSKIPYYKLIEDPEVLAQLARTTRSQSIVRTKIRKEGTQYRFDLEWLHAPDMVVMARESFTLDQPRGGEALSTARLQSRMQVALDRMIRKVPFIGSVTGRDGESVTVNIGALSGVEKGDELTVGTLDEVKRHPLLKEIVEWRFSNTGKVRIEEVEDRLAFGRIIEEQPDRQIMRQQKVTALAHMAPVARTQKETREEENVLEEPPRLGWVGAGLNLGGMSRSYSSVDNTIGKDGGGFAYGLKAEGQLWITRDWFAELGLNFAAYSYSQKDTTTGASSASTSLGSGSLLGFRLDGGYVYHLTQDILGPKGWGKLGYRSNSYHLPASGTDAVAPISFSSLFVGIGGEIPIRDKYGATMDFSLGIFNGVSEDTKLSGDSNSASDVAFSLGGYYRYTPRITFKATLDGQFNSAEFKTLRSVSQHVLTFVPAAVFYF